MTAANVITRLAPLSREIGEVAEYLHRRVVSIQNGHGGAGAGIIWKSTPNDSLIITNDHVVGRDRVHVLLPTGERADATLIGRDRANDLAALQIEHGALPSVEIGDSRDLRIGQLVVAVGHPFGVEHALTAGIVSALPRHDEPRELIRADLTLNPGNSGGPLADAAGRVIGINAMVASPGMALAIPSHVANAFVARAAGPTAWLGVVAQGVPLPPAYRARFGLEAPVGLLITGIEIGSPAHQSGLLPGDIVIGAAGQSVWQPRHLLDEIAVAGIGGPLALEIIRSGRRQELTIRLGARTNPAAAEAPKQRAA